MDPDYQAKPEGLYVSDDSGSHRICDQAVEVVSYSSLDQEYYIRWPSGRDYDHMATVPGDLLDGEDDAGIGQRLSSVGVAVDEGRTKELTRFLRRQASQIKH